MATFVLGILTFCTLGLSGLVGCVMGLVALRQIKRSGGQLRGQVLAIIGLVVSIISLAVLGGAMAVMVPEINRQQYKVGAAQCADNLKQVASSVRLNAEKHEGKFPAAADWCDAIGPQLGSEGLLQCPRRPELRAGYAYNRNVAGRTMSSVPPDIVLLIESDRGWNATASQEDPIALSVHGKAYCVAFADGSVRQVDASELSTLRWEP
ncbi:MAG TPA: DUF4190 domain-containing protein [Candidatus Dormibacteraeota bacterium]|nr:DUF4190 domain-containing protein [Candidatus Dormibacteraeota bacterium]